ncbi:MAG: MurR/RpiR family transcriptional regulator [Clostridia bacterium]|nr:MurR/RpiR family transcriptional regulator [Clostridia bacterium]
MRKDLFELMEEHLPEMSKSHKLIATYIKKSGEIAAYLTATKLGAAIGVSESTVVRFALELGFSGYPEFQSVLQQSLRSKLTAVQRIDVSHNMLSDSNVATGILTADMNNIKESLSNLDKASFNQAVDTICQAKNIFIIGIRSSSMLADFLNHYLCYMFGNVKLLFSNSTNELFEQIFRITKGDVLVAISFPRYSSRTKLAAEFAKKKGASVIAITDSDSSPISSYADSKLYAKSDMASFVDSLVAPLSIINALIAAIGRKKKDTIKETFDDLEKIWEEYDVYENGTK